jgi:ABC-type molybdate transport system permease subunit
MQPVWPAALETLRVAAVGTLASVVLGVWLGHMLRGRAAIAAASAPLILPPTIVCAYFLFRPFTEAVAIGAAILYGLPFLARAARLEFQRLDRQTLNAARSVGASEWRVFWRIALPLTVRPLAAAAALIFLRIGAEYAATLWIARIQSPRP